MRAIFISIFTFYLLFFSIKAVKLNPELQDKLDEYNLTMQRAKLIACLNLVTMAVTQQNGYKDLKKLMLETKYDREKLYTKYTMAMMVQCVDKIQKGQIDYLLIPENVDNYNLQNKTIAELIKITYDIKSTYLTNEEKDLYDEIERQRQVAKAANTKKKDKGIDTKYKIMLVSVFIFGMFFLINQSVKTWKNTPTNDVGTKELLDMIKSRASPKDKEKFEKGRKHKKE